MRAIAFLLLLATPAAAQTQTACFQDATGQVICNTRPVTPAEDRCAGGDWWLVNCTIGEHRAAKAKKRARADVGALIAAGKCDEAVRAAAGTGDLEFAMQVKQLCA